MKNHKIVLLMFVLMLSQGVFAQIGGLSATKLGAFSAYGLNANQMEFEPGFSHSCAHSYFDNSNNLQNIYSTPDSVKNISAMFFRFTYGITDKAEFGVSISTDMAVSHWGLKYTLYNKEKLAAAAVVGLNIPLGNRTIYEKVRTTDNVKLFGAGAVLSYQFNPRFSTDFTAQYMGYLEQTQDKDNGGVYFNWDVGYYLFNNSLQLMTGLIYSRYSNSVHHHEILTLDMGISVETAEQFSLAINFPFDVYGRNESKNRGFSFVATFLFN